MMLTGVDKQLASLKAGPRASAMPGSFSMQALACLQSRY